MSEPNLHHGKFCGYGTEYRGSPEKSSVIIFYYQDDKDQSGHGTMRFDITWIPNVKLLYMKVCDMYDQGMSIEAIESFFNL